MSEEGREEVEEELVIMHVSPLAKTAAAVPESHTNYRHYIL